MKDVIDVDRASDTDAGPEHHKPKAGTQGEFVQFLGQALLQRYSWDPEREVRVATLEGQADYELQAKEAYLVAQGPPLHKLLTIGAVIASLQERFGVAGFSSNNFTTAALAYIGAWAGRVVRKDSELVVKNIESRKLVAYQERIYKNRYLVARLIEIIRRWQVLGPAVRAEVLPRLCEGLPSYFAGLPFKAQARIVLECGWVWGRTLLKMREEEGGGVSWQYEGLRRYHTSMRMHATTASLYRSKWPGVRGVTYPLLALARYRGLELLPPRDQWAVQALVKDIVPFNGIGAEAPRMEPFEEPSTRTVTSMLKSVIGLEMEFRSRERLIALGAPGILMVMLREVKGYTFPATMRLDVEWPGTQWLVSEVMRRTPVPARVWLIASVGAALVGLESAADLLDVAVNVVSAPDSPVLGDAPLSRLINVKQVRTEYQRSGEWTEVAAQALRVAVLASDTRDSRANTERIIALARQYGCTNVPPMSNWNPRPAGLRMDDLGARFSGRVGDPSDDVELAGHCLIRVHSWGMLYAQGNPKRGRSRSSQDWI
jgi:hypothetical protein